MKKYYFLIIVALILGLVLTGCLLSNVGQVPTTNQSGITYLTKGGPTAYYPLYAGQDWLVGKVLVWNDEEKLCVRYELNEEALEGGWLLYETHWAVGVTESIEPGEIDVSDIPQTKKGNPIPGQFPYGDDNLGGVEFDEECISFKVLGEEIEKEIGCNTNLVIAAHAVIEKGCNPIGDVYGIQRLSGKVWGVDVLTGETAEIFTTVTPPKTKVGPNGLAYDGENKRFYYCNYSSTDTLYFWDGTQELVAGSLPGNIAAADFDDGKYYFITGPPASDDLYEVTFDANGYIVTTTKLDDIADDEHGWNFSGDIAVKDGVVYGWGLCKESGHGFEFFTYNLVSGDFAYNKPSHQSSLQLAFGLDGELYGHNSAGLGEFFVVDTAAGEVELPATCNTNGILFTDCASGAICEPISETAWGATEQGLIQFAGKNWATYFTYTVQGYCPCIIDASTNIDELGAPPPNVKVGFLEDDGYVRVWKEFEGPLSEDLYYDLDDGLSARTDGPPDEDLFIPAGMCVCIYYVHLDNDGPSSTVQHTGQITFGADILGLIISGGNLGTFAGRDLMFAADDQIGWYSGTIYPDDTTLWPPNFNYLRGFEVNYVNNLDDAEFNGSIVDFTMGVINAHDSFRVILPMVLAPCEE